MGVNVGDGGGLEEGVEVVGFAVGSSEGMAVGLAVGSLVGFADGLADGSLVGFTDGMRVGL